MKNKRQPKPRRNWHTITTLQLAITRALLAGDRRAVGVLEGILAEETKEPP